MNKTTMFPSLSKVLFFIPLPATISLLQVILSCVLSNRKNSLPFLLKVELTSVVVFILFVFKPWPAFKILRQVIPEFSTINCSSVVSEPLASNIIRILPPELSIIISNCSNEGLPERKLLLIYLFFETVSSKYIFCFEVILYLHLYQ